MEPVHNQDFVGEGHQKPISVKMTGRTTNNADSTAHQSIQAQAKDCIRVFASAPIHPA